LATSAAASSTPEAGGSTLERPKSEPGADPRQAESAAGIPTTMAQTELLVQSGPNRWLPLGVTMVAAVLLLFSFRVILGTRALRSFP
jgi:hypothetical protein